MGRDSSDSANVLAPPPLIFGVPLLAALYENTSHSIPLAPQPIGFVIGGVLLVVGLGIFVGAVVQFRKAHTPLVPLKPTTALVESGPYSFTRNPIYLAMTLIYIAVAFIFGTAWPLLLLPLVLLVMQRGVIDREERYLEGKFGDEYRAYKSRVRRWI